MSKKKFWIQTSRELDKHNIRRNHQGHNIDFIVAGEDWQAVIEAAADLVENTEQTLQQATGFHLPTGWLEVFADHSGRHLKYQNQNLEATDIDHTRTYMPDRIADCVLSQ